MPAPAPVLSDITTFFGRDVDLFKIFANRALQSTHLVGSALAAGKGLYVYRADPRNRSNMSGWTLAVAAGSNPDLGREPYSYRFTDADLTIAGVELYRKVESPSPGPSDAPRAAAARASIPHHAPSFS